MKSGGGGNAENCVILCESCHYSAHEGGNYKKGKVWGRIRVFPFFMEQEGNLPLIEFDLRAGALRWIPG